MTMTATTTTMLPIDVPIITAVLLLPPDLTFLTWILSIWAGPVYVTPSTVTLVKI